MMTAAEVQPPLADLSERELLDAVRNGDETAFSRLYQEHFNSVYAFAVSKVQERSAAEDLTSEAFVRFWKSISTFRGQTSVRSWLLTIVRNLVIDRRRRERLITMAPLDAFDAPVSSDVDPHAAESTRPEHRVIQAEEYERVWKALDELDEDHRKLLHLRYVEEWSYEQISQATGIPIGTVKSRIHRGVKALARRLT